MEALNEINEKEDDQEGQQPVFDPAEFLKRDPAPQRHAYKLGENVLRHWAEQGSQLRAKFRERAM
jgi:hypothetical protein